MSFPDSLRWHCPKFYARKQWETTLGLSSCEAWGCSLDGRIVGLLILVTNVSQHKKEKWELWSRPLAVFCTFATCPKLFTNKLLRRISTVISTNSHISYADDVDSSSYTWIELVVVSPHMWRKGLGARMLEFSIKRSSQLGREAVKLSVKPSNKNAMRLYEELGFKTTGQSKYGYIYTKVLCQASEL
jgi:GNAT superfamily N-acetyltransferase